MISGTVNLKRFLTSVPRRGRIEPSRGDDPCLARDGVDEGPLYTRRRKTISTNLHNYTCVPVSPIIPGQRRAITCRLLAPSLDSTSNNSPETHPMKHTTQLPEPLDGNPKIQTSLLA